MKILVVSGFLGAGKTTFIKEMIRRTGKQVVVLENEYGDNNLDSQSIAEVGELQILEFMEGCVCCTKKDSFANTILAISASLDPEYLVVEPTGVGKLGNILSNLQKVCYERIEILPPVVILTPRSIGDYLAGYPDIYKDQVRYAGQVIFSKIEQEDPAVVADACRRIRQINPNAPIIDHPYGGQPDDWWHRLLEGEDHAVASPAESDTSAAPPQMDQLTVHDGQIRDPGEMILLLEDILHGRFGDIPRAKGVIRAGGEWIRFDLADRLYAVTGEWGSEPQTQCVFIGNNLAREEICARLQATLPTEHHHHHHDHDHDHDHHHH